MVDIGGIMIKLPLVGPAYKMQSQSISCQNCINWYPQTIEYPNGSRVAALMPTPGLKKLFTGDVAATRCLFVLSNGALLTVIGKKLYHSKANKLDLKEIGLISALGTVRIADNGQVALIVNGTYTYALDLKKLTLTRLSGSTIPRSTHVLFLDGRFVVNKANTGQFYWSDLYSTKVNALSYATAESTPDNITAIVTFNRELWLFGAQSVERYYGTGSSNSPFSRLSGGAMAFGCLAPDSIVSLATGVIWLGVSEFGGNQIVMSGGGIPDRISTHALEEEISSFTKTSDASAYAYQIEGHVFYVISFPSANVTYCFDVSTGLWHQRSFTNAQGLHERHRSQHHAYFNNMHIVGDYRNGKLYQLDNNTFTDDGELILRERTAQAVITDKKLTRFSKLEIVCETGFGAEVIKDIPNPEPVGCEGAIPTCTMGALSYGGYYKIYVNDVEITESHRLLKEDGSRSLSTILKDDFNVVFVPLTFNLNESTDPYFNDVENGRFENRNPSYIKLRIVTIDASAINQQFEPLNGSMQLTPRPEEGASFCLSPYKPPMISCVGATQTIVFSPGPAFTGDINWTIEFDGVAYNLGKVWAGDIVNNMPSQIKDKVWMDWDGVWVLENRDSAPHRFKLTPSPKPEFNPTQGWSNNKSLLINDDGSFMFCLSAKVNVISCEGATNNSFFDRFGGYWDMEIDGVFNKASIDILPNYIMSNLSDRLIADYDGFLNLMNISDQDMRIKLIPIKDTFYDGYGNSTFIEHQDGSLTFCLKGVEPIYHPYAVLKTNALWGSNFPAKITVNGTEYSGDLFGNLADILAHQYNIYTGFERIYGDFEGDPDFVRVVFAGDVFAENASISVEFLSGISINIDDSFSYPENDTLKINGELASFNIGKLVCISKVAQYGNIDNSNYLLAYGQPFNFRVGDKINTNVLTDRIAGAGIEDPANYCASAASPEGCVQIHLLSNLIEQWNPELSTINVKADWVGHSQVVMPLNARDPFATAKFVVQPSEKITINDMYFLGYTIPKCDDIPS